MIFVEDAAAVLSRPVQGLEAWSKTQVMDPPESKKTLSPAAQYAIEAVRLLAPSAMPNAMICIAGATGSTAKAFQSARRASPDGRLTGPGFGHVHYRKIHPFTLIRSLQNQVVAALSMHFGICGPALNLLESTTALADALPNAQAMLSGRERLLLVLAAAAFREEERLKLTGLMPEGEGIEGAICFLLNKSAGIATIERVSSNHTATKGRVGFQDPQIPLMPILGGALALLRCLVAPSAQGEIKLADFGSDYHCALRWSKIT